jgi:CBS-domain-containing membrane protein
MNNFVTLDTNTRPKNEIDFDKDIDEILKDIEEDPDFKIEEEEIEEILKEIEEASSQKPTVTVDPDSI